MSSLSNSMADIKTHVSLHEFCSTHGLIPRGKNEYVCPLCGSGTHKNKSAAFHVYDDRWKCFSCGEGGDVFDLAGKLNGTDSKVEELRIVAEWAGIPLEGGIGEAKKGTEAKARPTTHGTPQVPKFEPRGDDATKYADGRKRHRTYIRDAQANISSPEAVAYLEGRGVDLEVAHDWGLGYDPKTRRIVIPWPGEDPYYHIDRSIDQEEGSGKYRKPKTSEVGPQPLWNEVALDEEAYFVVEGALDALAVQACGVPAVASCGASNRELTEAIIGHPGVPIVMLDFDKDESKGPAHQVEMCTALEAAGHTWESAPADALGGRKDAFEAWGDSREGLAVAVRSLRDEAVRSIAARADERYASALSRLRVLDPVSVAGDIYFGRSTMEQIPTGIFALDSGLDGGFPSQGLVVLGAVSSAGKTTLAVQLADGWASRGIPTLFVTIEQRAPEIVAKSLSRLVGLHQLSNGKYIRMPANKIMSARERARWKKLRNDDNGDERTAALCEACERYQDIVFDEDGNRRLYIMEGNGRPSVDDIRSAAERIVEHDGRAPVVLIDYLQLLGPREGHESDQERLVVNDNITALRQMAGDLGGTGTLVLTISALNRASYAGTIEMDSFRESGGIEYGADVILGLQPAHLEESVEGETSEASAKKVARTSMREFKRASIKDVELVVLKNRNGAIPEPIRLIFEAPSCYFTPPDDSRKVSWDF